MNLPSSIDRERDLPAEPRPLGELFKELANETGVLVKKEVELAKNELSEKATTVAKDAVVVVVGIAFALAGALAIFAAVILALGTVVPLWLSALIVGIVALGAGAALGVGGIMALKHVDPTPTNTVATLKENRAWLRDQMSR